jgi:tetratricopeptide (TPR) repeat protein
MLGMGLASQRMNNLTSAIEYFEAALDFASGPKGAAAGLIRKFSPTIYVSLGDAYYQKKDFEKAQEFLEKAKKLDKKEPLTPDLRYSLYGTLADIYADYNDLEEVRKLIPLLEAISKSFAPSKPHLNALKKRIG